MIVAALLVCGIVAFILVIALCVEAADKDDRIAEMFYRSLDD